MRNAIVTLCLVTGLAGPLMAAGPDRVSGPVLSGAEAEAFLRDAEILDHTPIGVGITRPEKVTLSDGIRTRYAVWKTVNEFRYGVQRGRRGGYQLGFRDSFQFEIAAYELDKLLGFGIVPPTVLRKIGDRDGSLQMWVEGGFTELERRERGLKAPDPRAWSEGLHALRLFQALVYDSDYLNIRNILYDTNFRVYSVDHSRAFRSYPKLLQEERLLRFSRQILERLSSLSAETLDAKLGEWLDQGEIRGLLARRDKILSRAESLVGKLGEDAVLYP